MRAPIHAEKHYYQLTFSTVNTVSRNAITLIDAVPVADKDATNEVNEGAIVKAVYLELWTISSAADGSQVIVICKDTKDGTGPTYAQCVALGVYNNKKNIIHVQQGLSSNDGISSPMCAFKGWIKIPKSKQRFGIGDTLILSIANPSANDLDYCGFATYKEYL